MMIDLRQGDCLELMKDIPDKSIDMILCDLPYGTTACKWDVIIPFDKLWEQYNRIVKDNGAIVLFGSEPFSSYLRMSNIKNYRYDWKWLKSRKTGFQMVRKRPLKCYEDILVFYNKQPTYHNTKLIKLEKPINSYRKNGKGGTLLNTIKCQKGRIQEYTNYNKDTLCFNNEHNINAFHPTQKPVELLEYLIETYTNDNETVLDNCAGSMSTVIASINTNRNCIALEKDKNYFEIGKKRVIEYLKTNNISANLVIFDNECAI